MVMERIWSALGARPAAQEWPDGTKFTEKDHVWHVIDDCKLLSWWSWHFSLRGLGHDVRLRVAQFSEQAKMTIDGVSFDVRKSSSREGQWLFDRHGQVICCGRKRSWLRRAVEIEDATGQRFVLKRTEAGVQEYTLEDSRGMVARINAVGVMTPRCCIKIFRENVDFHVLMFAYCLFVILWRRPY